MNNIEQIEDYEDLVVKAFANDSDIPLSNRDARHLMKHIYLNAKEKVRLLSDHLSISVPGDEHNKKEVAVHGWGELIGAAKKFLSSPANSLEILVNNSIDVINHPLLSSLKDVEGSVIVRKTQSQQPVNFMIGDEKAIRIESVEANQHRAMACANQPRVAQKFSDVFDELFESGTDLYRNSVAKDYLI